MKYLFYLLFVLLICNVAFAQNPVHFKIGEKEFANTNIYTLLYDDNFDLLYVGTDNGLFVYRQNKFVLLNKPNDQKGNSVFALKQNINGEIFCKNLNGQIFKVEGNDLLLYYQAPEKERNNHFSYYFDSENSIIVQSKNIIRKIITPTQSIILLKIKGQFHSDPPQTTNKDIYFFDNQRNTFRYSNGTFNNRTIAIHQETSKPPRFHINNVVYSFYKNNVETTDSSTFYNTVIPKKWEVFHSFKDQEVIGLDIKKGCRIIKMENDTLKEISHFFDNTFISTTTKNKNGILFLGTFGEGIIVVPKKKVIKYDYKHLFLGIAVSPQNNLFLSSRGGEVFEFKNNQLELIYERETNIDDIFYFENNVTPLRFSKGILEASGHYLFTTAYDFVSCDKFITWTNFFGVQMIENNNPLPSHKTSNNTYSNVKNVIKKKRCHAITYSIKDSLLFYSSNKSVFSTKWDATLEKEIHFNKKPFLCIDLEFSNDQLICATSKHGVLFFSSKGNLLKQLSKKNKLNSNLVRKIKILNNQLYILTNKGLQIYDLTLNQFIGLGFTEGMLSDDISNFALCEDKLWVLNKHSFYSINLSDLDIKKDIAQLYIDSILVNNKSFDYMLSNSFSYQQNQFDFYFDYRDIDSRFETNIKYTLVGFYTDWKEIQTSENKIQFQSLPPGDYIFKIKGVYRNQETRVFVYPFEIKPPYWQRWWFYGFISLSISLVLTIFFRTRLKQQKNEARLINELNTSKLTAIQSQMNPHFIFNALNSIQALVLRGDVDNSYAYINEFSDLVRITLNYSEKDVIPFEDELRLIKIYLNLEHLRFREDFEYTIVPLESDLDFSVPPMLIQPFIENALVHGLLHREGLKTIHISFQLKDVLICTIKDNGVGREVSKKINKRQNKSHESFATDAIQNRLNILSQRFKNPIGFKYEDLLDQDGKTIGTTTTIYIPIAIDL